MRRSSSLCVALLVVLALSASTSSAADPEVVTGKAAWTDGRCATRADGQLGAGPVPASEATFNGASPLLTLAVGETGGLYVGDTVAVREIADGRVSTLIGRAPSTSPSAPTSPVGLAPTEADVTVSGLAVAGDAVYFVNRAGTETAPTIQVLSVERDDPRAPMTARSPSVPAGGGPHGLAVDDAGTLYVTDASGTTGRLGRVGANQSIEWVTVPGAVESVAVDAAGDRAYVVGAADRVHEVDLTRMPPRVTPIGPALGSSRSKRVALDRASAVLFVADVASGAIEQIDLTQPAESRPLAGGSSDAPAVFAAGMGFGRDAAGTGRRLFVLDSAHCAVLSLAPLPPESAPTSNPGSAPSASAGEDRQTTQLTTPGARASDSGSPAAGADRVEPTLEDTGGRLTADDLVNQLLGGRSDGAFGGSQIITDEDLALLSAPGSRGEGLLSADVSSVAIEQAAASASPPLPPPPPVGPSPGPEAIVSSAAAAPPAPVPAAPPQPAGAPPPASGQVNPTPGWGGASSDAAEGAPRYASVRNDGEAGAAVVLTGLLVLGACSLAFALRVAGRGRSGGAGQPAPARAWVR